MISPPPVVLVGELNPYGANPDYALYHYPRGASGDRLRKILGLRDITYERLEKVNLCTGNWSMERAVEAREKIYGRTPGNYTYVLCGAKVRDVFGGPGFFESMKLVSGYLVTLPHPSGRNLLWNDPESTRRARELMRAVVPDVPWGELTPENDVPWNPRNL